MINKDASYLTPLGNSELICKAIELASKLHAGQLDKGGSPYIFHPIRVMNSITQRYGDNDIELLVIAILHDVKEDTEMDLEEFNHLPWVNVRISCGITGLTHTPLESYNNYITYVKKYEDCRVVKIADLKDNLNILRLKGSLSREDVFRINKYKWALDYLEN